jgi:hypothetical protein
MEGRFLIKLTPQVLTCSQNLNRSQNFWNKERDEEKLNQVHKFKSSCILLMNSHLASSLKPIYSTPFPLITYMCGRLYMELWESLVLPWYYKWDVVKTRQASHGLTETRQKGHWKIILYQGGEREKYTHLRWVDICKWQRMIPRHKGSPRYRIAHGWKIEYWSFNLEAIKFLMHFREPGSSLCSFFLFIIFLFLSFFIFLIFFLCSFS